MEATQNAGNLPANSTPRFALADNLANITQITRMWRAQWPEFSWLTVPGDATSRCYQMFAPDISRVGYGNWDADSDSFQVLAVMCPQQGIWIQAIEGTLNIEVTVTGSGGKVRESPMWIEAQITIEPKIWFSPDTVQNNVLVKLLWKLFGMVGIPFPDSKVNAIRLTAYGVDKQDQPLQPQSRELDIQNELDPNYHVPPFAMHNQPDIYGEVAACSVHLAVEIGQVIPTGNELADWFNALVMDIFNLASGNLLRYQNVLSWNVWTLEPEQVFTPEWEQHAEYWRFSLDVNHRSPEGNGRNPQYYNGEPFIPEIAFICNKLQELRDKLANEGLFSHLTLVKEVDAELSSIIANNCGGKVVFL